MNKSYKIYSVFILALFAVAGGFTLFSGEKEYSSNENRVLEKFPKFSMKSVLSGDYQDDLVSALNDQFAGRDIMMGISTDIKKTLGYKDIGGVYISKDGYYITKITSDEISQERYMQNLRYVQYLASKCSGKSVVLLVPSTGTILSDKLPAHADYYDVDGMYKAARAILSSSDVIDIRKPLDKDSKKEQIYYKTDHHWTMQGAYQGYVEFCRSAGIEAQDFKSFNPQLVSKGFYGTLYSKVIDRLAEADKMYAVNNKFTSSVRVDKDGKESYGIYGTLKLKEKDKYAYFFGGNYGRVDIKTGSIDGHKLLVIKDSFANSFVPFLLENYSEITMIDPRYYNGSVLKLAESGEYDQSLVLYEISNFAGDTNLYKLIQ